MRRDPNQHWEEDLVFEIGVWSPRGDLVEVTARAGVLSVAHSAFLGTAAVRPGCWVILRQRAHVLRELNRPPEPRPADADSQSG